MSFPSEKGDIVEKYEKISAQDDQIRRAQLKMQFQGTRKEDQETVESYVKKLQSIANSLAEINSPVSDQDLVLQLLAGLPCQYSPYQGTISSEFPLPDFSKACSLLYMYETLLQEQETTNPTSSEEGNYFNKELFDMLSSVDTMVSTACRLLNMFGTSSKMGNKKYYAKRPNGGRGNYSKRGGFRYSRQN